MGQKMDEIRENLRETLTGRTPFNDLRARLHADHAEVARLIAEMLATDDDEVSLREEIRGDITRQLDAHTRAEEEVLYAAIRARPALHRDAVDATVEHRDIERRLLDLGSADCADPRFLELVQALQQVVVHHVHDEENNLLPKAEREFGQDWLARLIPPFDARKEELLDEFVPNRAVAASRGRSRGLEDAPSQF